MPPPPSSSAPPSPDRCSPQPSGTADRFCVIGAGTSGMTVAKNFLQRGIPFDCLEREDTLGGNWCYGKPASSVYRSTHLISSKRLTEYTDFPLPEEYPEYPHHELIWKYLRSYADHFGLDPHIEYNTGVQQVWRAEQGGWNVQLERGEVRRYRGVVIANGHNWDPRMPDYPGTFSGQQVHSADYKTPDRLQGQRVLVVGGGNSGCDIAVEASQHAQQTWHSMRRGYHYLPKFFRGKPMDSLGERMLRWRVPLWLRRLLAQGVIQIAFGPPQQAGLPKPDHRLFETHPIINSQLIYHVAHGDLEIKPDIAELCGEQVRFVDGSTEQIDLIIYATGYHISFPFIDRQELNWNNDDDGTGCPQLYLNVFHPDQDDLFVAGLIQPDSGQWGIVDCQAQLIAAYLCGLERGTRSARTFQQRKATTTARLNRGIRYIRSPRHLLEVEHFSYRRTLERWIRKLG